jgi:hypothetical protein
MERTLIIALVLLAAVRISFAETHLSNEVKGLVCDPSGNPYIIDQDIIVPKDAQLTLKPGVIFLFKSFTGINVYGSIIVEGTTEKPVVFTSINDNNYNSGAEQLPNAFDWNGIYVSEESGNVKLRNFKLMFSVFGIKSKKDDIVLQNGSFKQNGQFHFTINDNIHYVQDNISYSYNTDQKTGENKSEPDNKNSGENKTTTANEKTNTKKSPKVSSSKRNFGVSLFVLSATSGAAAVLFGILAGSYSGQLKDISNSPIPDPKKWNDIDRKLGLNRGLCIGTGITCGISLPLGLLFVMSDDKSTSVQKVSLNLQAGPEKYGFGFTQRF